MKKVTGIGGIFFKCKNPKAVREWYQNHLGFDTNEWGSTFEWYEGEEKSPAQTQWSPFSKDTEYFAPSENEFMINYRVENIEELAEELKNSGVTILSEIQTYEYGKFLHLLDLEGNKIELWEPTNGGIK